MVFTPFCQRLYDRWQATSISTRGREFDRRSFLATATGFVSDSPTLIQNWRLGLTAQSDSTNHLMPIWKSPGSTRKNTSKEVRSSVT